jgi:hypothetical protein
MSLSTMMKTMGVHAVKHPLGRAVALRGSVSGLVSNEYEEEAPAPMSSAENAWHEGGGMRGERKEAG